VRVVAPRCFPERLVPAAGVCADWGPTARGALSMASLSRSLRRERRTGVVDFPVLGVLGVALEPALLFRRVVDLGVVLFADRFFSEERFAVSRDDLAGVEFVVPFAGMRRVRGFAITGMVL